jgi:hypothetical protein
MSRPSPSSSSARGLALLALATTSLACATSPRRVELRYPPASAAPETAVPERDDAPTVVVGAFTDTRPWSRIGEHRNAIGLFTERIEPDAPVEEWVVDGLRLELGVAGVPGATARADAAAGVDFAVSGRVQEAYVSQRFYYEGLLNLAVFVRCTCHGKIFLSRTYEEGSSLDTATEDGYVEALGRALQVVGRRLAQDVLALRPTCRSE